MSRLIQWFCIVGITSAFCFSVPAQAGSAEDAIYPLDEAVAAFRRVKPWVYFCQTQQIRKSSKQVALAAAVGIPLAFLFFRSGQGLMAGAMEWYVGEEIFAAL